MTVFFFRKKYNQDTQVLSIICNAICLQFSHYPVGKIAINTLNNESVDFPKFAGH
jgi:hypothetical protein